MIIPKIENETRDEQIFRALNLDYPGLENVKAAWQAKDTEAAKRSLVEYFSQRKNVQFLFDYRGKPLQKINPDDSPYSWQSSLGFNGHLREHCLYVAKRMMENVYVLPGSDRMEHDLGAHFENMIHFNFLTDRKKGHRFKLDMFTRGQFFESLAVLYHEEGDPAVAEKYAQVLEKFFETYNLVIEYGEPDAGRMQYTEDRDIMSIGWLTIAFISLLYTQLPYVVPYTLTFEMIKRIWFFSMQFRRFDTDSYRAHNHHMWERGLMPFMLSVLLPEFPEIAVMKERGRQVVCRHVHEDFNSDGGYSEHSIAYWSGAALGEMLFRGMRIANLNNECLLDDEAQMHMDRNFSLLAHLAAPGERYPSIGDNGGPVIDPILQNGVWMTGNTLCSDALRVRHGEKPQGEMPLDYCNTRTGFCVGKSGWGPKEDYCVMSIKENCGTSGHNHMDMLSLCIHVHGEPMIGEPYVNMLYHKIKMGSDERGFMYNMTSHNTVLAYGRPVLENSMYANKWGVYRPDTHVSRYESRPKGLFVDAYHDAYTMCRHNRQMLFAHGCGWIVRDSIVRGNRLPQSHIQRWFLESGVRLEKLAEDRVLLLGKEARLLCIWRKAPVFSMEIWRKDDLYPDIMTRKQDISDTIDIHFAAGKEQEADNVTVTVDVLLLDVTGRSLPEEDRIREFMTLLEKHDLADKHIEESLHNL